MAVKNGDGKKVAELVLTEKEFKTGSRGYFGTVKGLVNGERVQIQAQVVVIGSKPRAQ